MNRLRWRNSRLKFKTAGKSPILLEEFIEYTPILWRETGGCQHVTGWTCKHSDLNWLCPKISPITDQRYIQIAREQRYLKFIYTWLFFHTSSFLYLKYSKLPISTNPSPRLPLDLNTYSTIQHHLSVQVDHIPAYTTCAQVQPLLPQNEREW
jgi:hypothetical protein